MSTTATSLPQEENPGKTLDPKPHHEETTALTDAPLSNVEKKLRRAEHFGISPHLSEQDKRNSLAQRFGIVSASVEAKLEEQKKKARAERFGMRIPSTPAEEVAKKKAWLARFAPLSKIDPLDDEKKKARAVRFANPSSAIAGKAEGGA